MVTIRAAATTGSSQIQPLRIEEQKNKQDTHLGQPSPGHSRILLEVITVPTTPHKQALQNEAKGLLDGHLRTGEVTHSGQVHLQPGGERAGVGAENQPEWELQAELKGRQGVEVFW